MITIFKDIDKTLNKSCSLHLIELPKYSLESYHIMLCIKVRLPLTDAKQPTVAQSHSKSYQAKYT